MPLVALAVRNHGRYGQCGSGSGTPHLHVDARAAAGTLSDAVILLAVASATVADARRRDATVGLGSMAYVPMLKAREAEIKALMQAPSSLQVTPLFELQKASGGRVDAGGLRTRSKSAATDASYFLDDIARLWDEPLYVDISRVAASTQRDTWWLLLATLNTLSPAKLIPVVAPGDTAATLAAAAAAAAQTGRLALRVPMATHAAKPAALGGTTAAVAAATGMPASQVDVIFDWADHMDEPVRSLDVLERTATAAIHALSSQHGQIITVGTPNADDFQQDGDWESDRREWWLWLRLAHAGLDVTYGDYALYPPADPVPAAPRYGHLRYSSGGQLFVHRRAIPKTGGGLGAAFGDCCKHIVRQPHWLGAGYSKADQRLSDIAADADKESMPGGWRRLALEHHFTVVAKQLASPPAAPAPGTP